MDIIQAQKIIDRERAAWLFVAARLSDDELLRRRERWHNGLAMFFAFALLVGYFVLPTLWSQIGEHIAIYGTWGTLVGFLLAARQHSALGNRCRWHRDRLNAKLPNTALEPTAGSAFSLAGSRRFATPQFGGGSAFGR